MLWRLLPRGRYSTAGNVGNDNLMRLNRGGGEMEDSESGREETTGCTRSVFISVYGRVNALFFFGELYFLHKNPYAIIDLIL